MWAPGCPCRVHSPRRIRPRGLRRQGSPAEHRRGRTWNVSATTTRSGSEAGRFLEQVAEANRVLVALRGVPMGGEEEREAWGLVPVQEAVKIVAGEEAHHLG